MGPPAAPMSDCLILPIVVGDPELDALSMTGIRSDGAGVPEIVAHDQICLVPRVRRFLNAYLDVDALRREDFRKAIAFASHRFEFDCRTRREDIVAALYIAQASADIADATDINEQIDGTGAYSPDSDLLLLADAFAALAFAFRYVVGLYAADPMLRDLGEIAVRFVLLAESEWESALAGNIVAFPARALMTSNAFGPNEEFKSIPSSMFVPATAVQSLVAVSSAEVISRRSEQLILLTA
jgi:hypothetical protein